LKLGSGLDDLVALARPSIFRGYPRVAGSTDVALPRTRRPPSTTRRCQRGSTACASGRADATLLGQELEALTEADEQLGLSRSGVPVWVFDLDACGASGSGELPDRESSEW